MNKFIWKDGIECVEMTVDGNPPLTVLLEAFTRFLQAQGYVLPTPFSTLEFVDSEVITNPAVEEAVEEEIKFYDML